MTLHDDTMPASSTSRFRQMVSDLRKDRGYSLGQICNAIAMQKIVSGDRPEQVFKDVTHGREVPRVVYKRVKRLWKSEFKKNGATTNGRTAVSKPKSSGDTYQARVLAFFEKHGGPLPYSTIKTQVTGQPTVVASAVKRLVDEKRLRVASGPWPPQRGQNTVIDLPRKRQHQPAPEPDPTPPGDVGANHVTTLASDNDKGPTLNSVRRHIRAATEELTALSNQRLENVPAVARDVVKGQYQEIITKLEEVLRDQLGEEET